MPKYDYVDCFPDNFVGYSAEYLSEVMSEATFRRCLAKAIRECDKQTLSWLAKRLMDV